jgi:hypothetical protein
LRNGRVRLARPRDLLHCERLSRQCGLVDEQILRLEQHPVRGNQGASSEHDDVLWDDILHWYLLLATVAQHFRAHGHEREELRHRRTRRALVPEPDDAGENDDGNEDQGLVAGVDDEGEHGCDDEHQDERTPELREQERHTAGRSPLGPDLVAAMLADPARRVRSAQAGLVRAEPDDGVFGRPTPEASTFILEGRDRRPLNHGVHCSQPCTSMSGEQRLVRPAAQQAV